MVVSTNEIASFIDSWLSKMRKKRDLPDFWRDSLVAYLSADNPGIDRLKELVTPDHYKAEDFLEGAKSVICFFLPFKAWLGESNIEGAQASEDWAQAYTLTNALAIELGEAMIDFLAEKGIRAAYPYEATIFPRDNPRSRWSQRHLAYYAGLGSFGINNLLISKKGSMGRYFSLISEMEIEEKGLSPEYCLYKIDSSCTQCIDQCIFGALDEEGFDRLVCLKQLDSNEKLFDASVCGKCAVGLPCSLEIPKIK